jgi:hypothetical protein
MILSFQGLVSTSVSCRFFRRMVHLGNFWMINHTKLLSLHQLWTYFASSGELRTLCLQSEPFLLFWVQWGVGHPFFTWQKKNIVEMKKIWSEVSDNLTGKKAMWFGRKHENVGTIYATVSSLTGENTHEIKFKKKKCTRPWLFVGIGPLRWEVCVLTPDSSLTMNLCSEKYVLCVIFQIKKKILNQACTYSF